MGGKIISDRVDDCYIILHIMGGKIISDGVEASICGAIFYEKLQCTNMSFSFNPENLTLQILSVLQ